MDTLGFPCARKVTGYGRGRPGHPLLALARVDGGYANAVDDSLIDWSRQYTGIVVEVVRRTDDVKGFSVLPWCWVVERTNAWLSAHRRLAREYERLVECCEAMIDLAHDRRHAGPAGRRASLATLARHRLNTQSDATESGRLLTRHSHAVVCG